MTALSVLDLVPVRQGHTAHEALAESAALARHVEALGYSRFWVAEQFGKLSASFPARRKAASF